MTLISDAKAVLAHGSCLCGAIRFHIAGPPGPAEYCHCSMCRKAHGSAFSVNTVVASSALTFDAGRELLSEYSSSPNRLKCFCSKCGSQLFIRRTDKPEIIVVALAAIDGDPGVRPQRHVFVGSKAPWDAICDGLPQFKIYPGYEE